MDTLLTDYLNSNSLECVPSYQQSELNDRYLNVKNSSNIDCMDRDDEHLEKNNEKYINLDEDDNIDYHSDLPADNLILSCEDSEELIDDIQFKEIGERYKILKYHDPKISNNKSEEYNKEESLKHLNNIALIKNPVSLIQNNSNGVNSYSNYNFISTKKGYEEGDAQSLNKNGNEIQNQSLISLNDLIKSKMVDKKLLQINKLK